MSTTIKTHFQFHPVGQGLFYSGVFDHSNGQQFTFVYDCGTESSRQYINREIANFTQRITGDKLDLLILSHMHEDHINKVTDLLTQSHGAKYAILPYLSPDELILALAENKLRENDPNINLFLSNPTEFLLENKVEKVVYIHPGNDENGNEDLPNEPDKPGDNFTLNFKLKSKPEHPSIANEFHYFDQGEICIDDFWEFKFFNKSRDPQVLHNFKKAVEVLIGAVPTPAELERYIVGHQRTFKEELKRIYEQFFGKGQAINDTSLVVYHAISPSSVLKCLDSSYFHHPYYSLCCLGTILTGDIVFDQACIDEIEMKWNHLRFNIDIGVFQIPHHGSRKNTFPPLFGFYPDVKVWVVNFGLGNRHKHPTQQVIDMIVNNSQGWYIGNTQVRSFKYRGFFG